MLRITWEIKSARHLAESKLGPDHPAVAEVLHAMGVYHEKYGEWSKAEECFVLALDIKRCAFGAGHPEVVKDVMELDRFYQGRGKWGKSKGETLHWGWHMYWSKALGRYHPLVAESLIRLSWWCRQRGKHLDAVVWLREALKMLDKALASGRPEAALALRLHAVAKRELEAVEKEREAILAKARARKKRAG